MVRCTFQRVHSQRQNATVPILHLTTREHMVPQFKFQPMHMPLLDGMSSLSSANTSSHQLVQRNRCIGLFPWCKEAKWRKQRDFLQVRFEMRKISSCLLSFSSLASFGSIKWIFTQKSSLSFISASCAIVKCTTDYGEDEGHVPFKWYATLPLTE